MVVFELNLLWSKSILWVTSVFWSVLKVTLWPSTAGFHKLSVASQNVCSVIVRSVRLLSWRPALRLSMFLGTNSMNRSFPWPGSHELSSAPAWLRRLWAPVPGGHETKGHPPKASPQRAVFVFPPLLVSAAPLPVALSVFFPDCRGLRCLSCSLEPWTGALSHLVRMRPVLPFLFAGISVRHSLGSGRCSATEQGCVCQACSLLVPSWSCLHPCAPDLSPLPPLPPTPQACRHAHKKRPLQTGRKTDRPQAGEQLKADLEGSKHSYLCRSLERCGGHMGKSGVKFFTGNKSHFQESLDKMRH